MAALDALGETEAAILFSIFVNHQVASGVFTLFLIFKIAF
jgi:hypothetical protein